MGRTWEKRQRQTSSDFSLLKIVRLEWPKGYLRQNVQPAALVLDGRLRGDPTPGAGGPGCDETERRKGPRARREAERPGEPRRAPAGGEQAVQRLGRQGEEEDVLGGHEDEDHHRIHRRHCHHRHHHLGLLLTSTMTNLWAALSCT